MQHTIQHGCPIPVEWDSLPDLIPPQYERLLEWPQWNQYECRYPRRGAYKPVPAAKMNHFYTLHDVVREDDAPDVSIAPGEVSLAVPAPDEE